MPMIPLQYPPGIYRNGTEYQAKGRAHDGRYVRWDDAILKPMGGWTSVASGIVGNASDMHTWTDEDFLTYIAVGSTDGVFTQEGTGGLADRTPIGFDEDPDGVWTMGNLGQSLIACMDTDGTIWRWNTADQDNVSFVNGELVNQPVAVSALENAPEATATVVTEHGFVVALGAGGDPRLVRTSNLRQPTVWAPALTNQAREFTLQTSGEIMCGQQVRGGTLIFTTEDLHLMTYTASGPLYNRVEKIPGSRGIIGRNAKASVDTSCYFMGGNNFWVFNGFVRALPCDVEDDVFTNMNRAHAHKVQCFHNADEQEIWWLYPRGSAVTNSHYVIFNYAEGNQHWNHGQIDRACGVGPGGGFDHPHMVGGGTIYRHEDGFSYDGVLPFMRGGPLELGNGDQNLDVFRMLSDESNAGSLEVTVRTRFDPNGPEHEYGPYQSGNPMGVRFSGRQAALEFKATAANDWRAGIYRADAQAAGRR